MVSLNPVDTNIIKLTPDEQLILIQHCSHIDDDIHQELFSAHDGILTLTARQCSDLRHVISIELNRTSNPKTADALGSVYNKLCTNPVMRKIGEKFNKLSFEDIEQVQKAADKIMLEHNNTPDPALGGLTPIQTHHLLYTEWNTSDCPMKLNQAITFEDVKDAPLYHNVRALLEELLQLKDKPTATAKGNLSRKVVQGALKTFRIDNYFVKTITETSKTLNEQDISSIWTTRVICQLAGLIRKQKNKFLVTKKGQELLALENAGKLYHLLFLTYTRKFNIGFHDRLPDLDELQFTIAYTLYHLNRLAKDEVDFDKIYRKIVLPSILKEFDRNSTEFMRTSWIIRYRIIEPLEFAGLLDCTREKVKFLTEIVSLKTSKFLRKFIRFQL